MGKTQNEDMKQKNKYVVKFVVNNLLLLTGIITIISGLVIQLGFHLGSADKQHGPEIHSQTAGIGQLRETDPAGTVWGIDYSAWSAIHKVAIVLLSLLMVYHFIIHWNWYKAVFSRHLISKNRQGIILSFLFLAVASTGLIPWFIELTGGQGNTRVFLIGIHDKLALFLTVYLILHVTRRAKWFSGTFKKLHETER